MLPRTIAKFRKAARDVTVRVQTTESPKVHDALTSGLSDTGIAATPFDATRMRVQSFALPCVAILSKSNELARTRNLSARALDDIPFVAAKPDRLHHHAVAQAFRKAGVVRNVVREAGSFSIAAEIVAGSDCVAIVDALTARGLSQDLAIRLSRPMRTYDVALYRGSDVQLRPVVEKISDAFCNEAAAVLKSIHRELAWLPD